jgi:pyridoxamine 5'-phosphate oxidase family protein
MSKFSNQEIEYLQSQRLGRLATLGADGDLHVVPVGFRYNPDEDTIDIGGHNHGRVAFVVDDVLPPWRPRFVEMRGTVQAFLEGGETINIGFNPEMLRLTPTYIVSFGINDEGVMPGTGKVNIRGRRVG